MNYGDFAEDATVHIPFPSRDTLGAASAFDSTPTVTIYKNNSTTQKATTNGVTLSTSFDATDGQNTVEIDTSNDTGDAGFWATGNDYHVWLSGTIDGVSVVELIGHFSIENRTAANLHADLQDGGRLDLILDSILSDTGEMQGDLENGGRLDLIFDSILEDTGELQSDWTNGGRLDAILDSINSASSANVLQSTTIATLASQTSFTLTAGSPDNDAYNGLVAVITDQSTSTQKAVVPIMDYVGSTKTVTLPIAPGFTIAAGDSIAILAIPALNDVYTPWLTINLDDVSGTNAEMKLWLFDRNFNQVDVGSIDASASGTISVREYGSGAGVALFTDTFANTDIVNGCFEKTKASPGFSATTLYVATITVTANGVTYTNRIDIPVGP